MMPLTARLNRYATRPRTFENANGAPVLGRRREHVILGYQACTSHCQTGYARPDTPPAAGRASVRSVQPLYVESAWVKRAERVRFVISISVRACMPRTEG